MASKVLVVMTLLLAVALLMTSSEVATASPADTTTDVSQSEKPQAAEETVGSAGTEAAGTDQGFRRFRCRFGCCRFFRGRCIRCCRR